MGNTAVKESDPEFFKRPDFADVVLSIPEPSRSTSETPVLVAPSTVPKKQYEFSMNKLSLLGISLGLMILGAVCFGLGITATLYYTYVPHKISDQIIIPQTAASNSALQSPAMPTTSLPPTQTPTEQTSNLSALGAPQQPESALSTAPQEPTQGEGENKEEGFISKALKGIGLQNVLSMWAGQESQAQVMTYLPEGPKALQSLTAPLAGRIAAQTNLLAQRTVKSAGLGESQSEVPAGEAAMPGAVLSATQPFTLQLGLFSAKANAAELVTRLQSFHYPAAIVEKHDASLGAVYAVQSGTYPNYDDAAYAAQLFFKEHDISAMPLAIPQAVQPTPSGGAPVTQPIATGATTLPTSLTPPTIQQGAAHGTP